MKQETSPPSALPAPAPTPANRVWLGPQRVLLLSIVALVVVLLGTWFLVPKASAPFIYMFF